MVGKGQPPKPSEYRRKNCVIRISAKEREIIEEGKSIIEPEKGFTVFVRDAALEKAQKAIEESKK